MPDRWEVAIADDGETHVRPIDDLREHTLDGFNCWCRPSTDGNVLVHHSADGREEKERH